MNRIYKLSSFFLRIWKRVLGRDFDLYTSIPRKGVLDLLCNKVMNHTGLKKPNLRFCRVDIYINKGWIDIKIDDRNRKHPTRKKCSVPIDRKSTRLNSSHSQ